MTEALKVSPNALLTTTTIYFGKYTLNSFLLCAGYHIRHKRVKGKV